MWVVRSIYIEETVGRQPSNSGSSSWSIYIEQIVGHQPLIVGHNLLPICIENPIVGHPPS